MEGDVKQYYINQYKQLHKEAKGNYGVSGHHHLPFVLPLIDKEESVLDYGCGNSTLLDKLPNTVKYRYDPAIEKYNEQPDPSKVDVVICTDVMEHVPEVAVDEVLKDIHKFSDKALFVISMREAAAKLPNGENAHTTVKDKGWWFDKIGEVFGKVQRVKRDRPGLLFLKTF